MAKINCLTNGDRNTKYFHNSVKIRRHKNKIRVIKDISGNIYTDQTAIENCFMNFCHNLWSTTTSYTLDSLLFVLPNDLPVLNDIDAKSLIRPITKREVYSNLKTMPSGKSPGPNGLNSEFYIYYWNQIGNHLLKDIT